MATINIPRMDRPAPRMPQGRIYNDTGDTRLYQAKDERAAAGASFLAALAGLGGKIAAEHAQDEYNRKLIEFKDMEAQKLVELQNFPKETTLTAGSGEFDDRVPVNQNILKNLPNTDDFRTWRKETLDNVILPGMKSSAAKKALTGKIAADSIETDAKLADFDFKTSKARLSDSYNVRLQQDISTGSRESSAATIIEMQSIGMINETDKNNLLDNTFAVIKSNEAVNAALQASFATKKGGYGDENAGKKILQGNTKFIDHAGVEREIDTAETNKRFDTAFKDQRQAFVNKMDEQFAKAEDQATQLFIGNQLSKDWVEKTFVDVPGTTGRSQQRYWLGQVESQQKGTSGEGSVMLPDALALINNPFMDKSVKQEELFKLASKNPDAFPPEVLKTYTSFITDAQNRIDPKVLSTLNIFAEAKTKAEAIAKKKPEEGNAQLQKLYEVERSTLRSLALIGAETDVTKRDKRIETLQTDLIKITSDINLLNMFEGTPQEVGAKVVIAESSGGRYNIEYDTKLDKMKGSYSDVIATTSQGENVRKQITEYEGTLLKDVLPGIETSELVRGSDGKFAHVVPATSIKAANAKTMNGKTIVRFDKDEKGNQVLQYLTNSKDKNNNPVFQTYEIKPNRSRIQSNMEGISETQKVFDSLYGGGL